MTTTIEELRQNVLEYQKVVEEHPHWVSPEDVAHWYFIPFLNMVAPSKFIGYAHMNGQRYQYEPGLNGGVTERHLSSRPWFNELSPGDAGYAAAASLAARLSPKRHVKSNARFSILKDDYDGEVRRLTENDNSHHRDPENAVTETQMHRARPADFRTTPRRTEYSQTKGRRRVKVNPGIAKRRLMLAGYRCEADPNHGTFTSQVTGQSFVESHHLIPLCRQEDFGDNSLDHEMNIFALCPTCHRLIHHASFAERRRLVEELFARRGNDLRIAGMAISAQRLTSYYA